MGMVLVIISIGSLFMLGLCLITAWHTLKMPWPFLKRLSYIAMIWGIVPSAFCFSVFMITWIVEAPEECYGMLSCAAARSTRELIESRWEFAIATAIGLSVAAFSLVTIKRIGGSALLVKKEN